MTTRALLPAAWREPLEVLASFAEEPYALGLISDGSARGRWSYLAWQKIWRLAGADHMHVNGLDNKFSEDDGSVMRSARECLTPMFPNKPCLSVPVFSSGQTVRQAPGTFAGLGSTDLIVTAGGGIMAHPNGPAAGVTAFREAWQAAVEGVPLAQAARTHDALAQALAA